MTTGAMIFMGASWLAVLGLTVWAYSSILGNKRHFDPDGIGPAEPPVKGRAERD